MRQIPRSMIVDALDNAGFDEDCLRENYSGRGMYGTTCPAVTLPGHNEAFRFFVELAHLATEQEAYGDVSDLADTADWDTMGRSDLILYWRGLELTED